MINLVGQSLGNYRILHILGRGGFADVYLGEHQYLKTLAAIKVIHTTAPMSSSNLQEFLKEAQMIAALKHPHIVRILEFGQEKNTPFLVMDYAARGTLRTLHPKRSELPITTILPYVKQVAIALQYAHDHKVVHQDVKPENMLVDTQGEIILSDFGIAVVAHSTSSLKTQSPSGTPLYMAPEQWEGKSRPASDQYALGIVVYEWLNGKCPFQGNIHALPYQHKSVPPPPFDSRLQIPSHIEDVVQKALSKDPEQRFPSVETFAVALEQASRSDSPPFEITSTILGFQQPVPIKAGPIRQQAAQIVNLQLLYQEGVKARERGDLAQAVLLWQEILQRDPSFQNGTLTPQMIELLRQRALQAGHNGEWEEAGTTWRALLRLKSDDPQANVNLAIADDNQKYTWMYQNAQQFVDAGDLSSAKKLLAEVWRNAPQYGDPKGLAKRAGLHALLKKIQHLAFIQDTHLSFTIPIYRIFLLPCLLSGLGTTIGLLTQSWFVAIGVVAAIAMSAWRLVYRRAIAPLTLTLYGCISAFVAFSITWYASTFLYQQAQESHLWLIGSRTLWIGEQINFGLVIGALSICVLVLLDFFTKLGLLQTTIWASIWLIMTWILAAVLGSFFQWGFGFGFGWQFSLGGVFIGLITAFGVPTLIMDFLLVIGVINRS